MVPDVRWKQRFENFQRAVELLREPIDCGLETLSTLEKEGLVQRFEVAVELGWKTLKDYMEAQGAVLDQITPRFVVKEAFAAKVLADGQAWIDMLDHRNLLSHTYDSAVFEQAVLAIRDRYLLALEELCAWLRLRYGDK